MTPLTNCLRTQCRLKLNAQYLLLHAEYNDQKAMRLCFLTREDHSCPAMTSLSI
jgi:hypothetical protein